MEGKRKGITPGLSGPASPAPDLTPARRRCCRASREPLRRSGSANDSFSQNEHQAQNSSLLDAMVANRTLLTLSPLLSVPTINDARCTSDCPRITSDLQNGLHSIQGIGGRLAAFKGGATRRVVCPGGPNALFLIAAAIHAAQTSPDEPYQQLPRSDHPEPIRSESDSSPYVNQLPCLNACPLFPRWPSGEQSPVGAL